MTTPNRYSPEIRERAVRPVSEAQKDHQSEWAAMVSVSEKIGCTRETLRRWVRQAQRDQGLRPGLSTEEKDRLKPLEREIREFRKSDEILRKASALFARAELDRR